MSWIEQYHQVDPSTGGLTELALRWRAEHTKAPERFLTPLGIRGNAVGAMALVPSSCSGDTTPR
eukprot:1260248-Alexandrium_andersonii.AAC.1